MAARLAAVGGHAQEAPETGEHALGIFGRNALEVLIPTDGAMGAECVTQWHHTGIKAFVASFTTPGQKPDHTEDVVGKRASARPSGTLRTADWAIHSRDPHASVAQSKA